MIKDIDTVIFRILLLGAGTIFLSISPWVNKDSIVVPKVILLFLLAAFLLPSIVKKAVLMVESSELRILIICLLLITVQMIIVMLLSEAPIEQQIFGKMGRGLGFISSLSFLILILAGALYVKKSNLNFLLNSIIIIICISTFYSVFQSFGLDFVKWETKTNAIFGTLGNPNFQSAAASLIIVPCLLIARKNIKLLLLSTLLTSLNFYVIIKTASVQGLVGTIIGVSFLIAIYLYYRNRLLFIGSAIVYLTGLIVGVLGMVNQGPLKGVSVGQFTLYKASVESRGDFWRSAIAMIQDNPLFGVGLDSFGDYFLTYRDEIAVKHEFSEFTDSSHNYYLEYAATGGIPLLLLHLIIILLSVWGIIKLIRNSIKFDRQITTLITIWLIYIAQSFISPGALGLIVIGSIVMGAIIGLSSSSEIVLNQPKMVSKSYTIKQWRMNIFLILISIVILLPYFNTDRLYLNALNSGDGVRLAESTKRFPEFTQRYSTASRLLLESKLYEKSLEVARSAIEFNPRNVSPWAHIFLNPISTPEEKQKAKEELIKLDPNNSALLDLKVGG